MQTVLLLIGSNLLMTFAWYGHLKYANMSMFHAIVISWGIAFFEYCLAVPANRIGYGQFSLAQLKVMQEVITLSIYPLVAIFWLGETIPWNYLVAFICLIAAVLFMFVPVK